MKILFLAHSFPRTATDPVGSFIFRLAVALRERGVDVRVLAPSAPGLAEHEVLEGIEIERFRYAPRSFESLAYTGTMRDQVAESWSARFAFAGLIAADFFAAWNRQRRQRPDIVHAHWWFPAGLVSAWLRPITRVPFVTTMHGSDLRIARSTPAARRPFRYVMRRSSVVTTVSQWLAQETTAMVPDVRPLVAPMPIEPTLFFPSRERERNRLLFVGKLNAQKGIEHLIRALALMHARPTLDIVVGVGSREDETRSLAESLGVASQLRWHALLEQAELATMYRRATALVVPAVDEGLGLTAIEALFCETPVVAFASGGLTDIVVHDRTGLLVPPRDAQALAVQLDALLSREDQGASLGQAGRIQAMSSFAPAAAASRYADIYESVIGRRTA